MPTMPKTSATGRRAPENLLGLGRTSIQSHYRMALDNLQPGAPRPPLQDFDNSEIWEWIRSWVKATYETDIESLFVPGDRRHAFEPYPATGERGHYDLSGLMAPDGSIRIGLAGDWGTGTDVAQQVADSMVRSNPELTIHLGDVYYVGERNEVKQNCLGVDTATYKGVVWRKGARGSFALNGNHEMYSGGHGYFEDLLPQLGIPDTQDKQQLRSYFCLETKAWRILAIDTGYNSDTLFGGCRLEQTFLDWLSTVVDPVHNRKPTVLLSHHQWFSGFGDGDYGKPAGQMAPYLKDQEFVWLWGHEHRLAVFYKYKSADPRLTTYARCIGHGGMPIEMPDAAYPNSDGDQKVEYWDGLTDLYPDRFHKLEDGTVVGTNGYVEMVIKDSALTLEYLDADGTSVLKESFVPGGGGAWDGTLARTVVNDPHILNHITYE